ncbi:hypothetical protein [Nocardia sp. NBC_01009]|uniref:hypothetical protein n=1 Tax=Nocardia sp. NBC_01009 TaxID=2975996 RepID=UPI0038636B38|nr:hypothetical protein OHA42_26800 [Nocardia sp. NBC_01009]
MSGAHSAAGEPTAPQSAACGEWRAIGSARFLTSGLLERVRSRGMRSANAAGSGGERGYAVYPEAATWWLATGLTGGQGPDQGSRIWSGCSGNVDRSCGRSQRW